MRNSTQPKTWVRVVNAILAMTVVAVVLGSYARAVKVVALERASLGIEAEWIGGHAKQIKSVMPGGPADRAGLNAGDILQFDPIREGDWVLVGYRNMPKGFSATLPVRHADGSMSTATLVPDSVAYLPTLNDRLALLSRIAGLGLAALAAVFLVWARPCLMTWSLLLAYLSGYPTRVFADYYLGFEAHPGFNLLYYLPSLSLTLMAAFVLFALSFPRHSIAGWPWWKYGAAVTAILAWAVFQFSELHIRTFAGPVYGPDAYRVAVIGQVIIWLASIAALARTYQVSDGPSRARLRWGLLGLGIAIVGYVIFSVLSAGFVTSDISVGSELTAGNWLLVVSAGIVFPVSLAYAILRERVVDVQFAISRTVVYGVVSTIVVVFLAVLHWLLGRMIEHSGFAFGLEGLAAVGLGLVLHRASHSINTTVDRVLFRKHHAAEERLRQVTAALPFAGTEQSIAQAIVVEPTRNLELASAALFYREGAEGPLRRVLAVGWGDSHAGSLDAESLLVRYLQAEHSALRLDDEHEWLPAGVPEGAAHPVLAVPVVAQHALAAVVLYGAHVNSTLPDPDEVALLEALAKAAAASHQQVRIAMLMREKAAAERAKAAVEKEVEACQVRIEEQQKRIGDLETSSAELRELVRVGLSGPQGAG